MENMEFIVLSKKHKIQIASDTVRLFSKRIARVKSVNLDTVYATEDILACKINGEWEVKKVIWTDKLYICINDKMITETTEEWKSVNNTIQDYIISHCLYMKIHEDIF